MLIFSKGDFNLKVKLNEVSMNFGNIVAVNGLNIEINEGELVTFLGPSGCGKSTTLFLIAGLYKPVSGSIMLGEEDVTYLEPEDRGIGMVFQNYALYPHMTVLKNILFPLKMQKVKKDEALKRAEEMAVLVGIEDLLHRKPGQLSGGQQQRVAIARALVKKPKILLLDEPLSNLDARLRIETREEIRRIQKEVGITTVFVTHDQEEALSISDRVLLMKDGICQQYDSPQNLYTRPANLFVAKFLGNPAINIFEGIFKEMDKNVEIDNLKTILTIPNTKSLRSLGTRNIKIGIRPEDFYIVDKNEEWNFKGIISHIEIIGKDVVVKVQIGNRIIRCIFTSDVQLKVADEIYLKIKENKMHLFNSKTEANYFAYD